jgi:diguanylate cyclase (GGDEF)-like protein
VRAGGDALPALRRAASGFDDTAPYADQLGYLQLLAQAERDAGRMDDAYAVDDRIAWLAEANGDATHAAVGALGDVARKLRADPTAALKALGALDTRNAAVRDPQFVAMVQQTYGDVYLALGQFDFALGHYLKALDLVRRHPDILGPRASDLWIALAKLYTYTGAPDKIADALASIDDGHVALPALTRVRIQVYRGLIEAIRDRQGEARAAYERALALARAHGLTKVEANILGNIADTYLEQTLYPQAERAARDALPVAERSGDVDAVLLAKANLGLALLGQGRIDDGSALIDEVAAAKRKAASPDLKTLLAEESLALERAGQTGRALAVLREQNAVAVRQASVAREKSVAVLQEQFNAQQRAIQIDALRRENALKDREIAQRRIWQLIASGGAGLALLLCGFVYRLYRRSRRTQRRLEELNQELAFHSTHDALTGLLNRRSFRERMMLRDGAVAPGQAGQVSHPGRSGGPRAECFILIDIDHFKPINDRYGHGAGDEVLVEVARRLREMVGERGLTMRWGGEEFLVYVESDNVAGAVDHAALLRDLLMAMAGQPLTVEGGATLTVTVSAGALSLPVGAGFGPASGADDRNGDVSSRRRGWQQAVALADHALYKSKADGRNRAYLIDGAGASRLILPACAAAA